MKTLPKVITTVIASLLLIGLIWLIGASPETGTLLTITAAQESSEEVGVDDIQVTIESISLYQEADGWQIINRPNKTISLLEDRPSATKLLGSNPVPVGTYEQIRINISEVIAVNRDGDEISVPIAAEEIISPSISRIETNATSSISFLFQPAESLQRTSEGDYQFLPHIELKAYTDIQMSDLNADSVSGNNGYLTSHTVIRSTTDGNYVRSSRPTSEIRQSSASTSSADDTQNETSTTSLAQ